MTGCKCASIQRFGSTVKRIAELDVRAKRNKIESVVVAVSYNCTARFPPSSYAYPKIIAGAEEVYPPLC